jgi:hypothetical protein
VTLLFTVTLLTASQVPLPFPRPSMWESNAGPLTTEPLVTGLPEIALPEIALPGLVLPGLALPAIEWPAIEWPGIEWPAGVSAAGSMRGPAGPTGSCSTSDVVKRASRGNQSGGIETRGKSHAGPPCGAARAAAETRAGLMRGVKRSAMQSRQISTTGHLANFTQTVSENSSERLPIA